MISLRTKITILNVAAITVAVSVATIIGTISAASLGHSKAEQALSLLCESGKNNLNNYFKSVEQSINTVSDIIDEELNLIKDENFNDAIHDHVENNRSIFNNAAKNTAGVLTYYYRLDPSISDETGELGFWYTNLDGKGFVEHEVTDISDDQFECRWFYGPKNSRSPVWLSPYVTDNLDIYVVSYNVPVYRNMDFVGVVGIEIDYRTLGDQIKNIQVLKTGYAFVIENVNGTIIYHPQIDILSMPEDQRPTPPPEFIEEYKKGNHHIAYVFQGVEKHSHWLDLSNGMAIVVTVPLSEVNETWTSVILQIVVAGLVVIAAFAIVTIVFANRITKPLEDLTMAAEEINKGNYDVKLTYNRNDEIGVLTSTVNNLTKDLEGYINNLSGLAYADALTSVGNKGAFDLRISELQAMINEGEEKPEFAIAVFDCDELKTMNDNYGHEKGDIYLRNSCNLISQIFEHSVVYRIGGDEFAVILQGEDYKSREELKNRFVEKSNDICEQADKPWEKIRVSVGIATYDPRIDKTAEDVIDHADHLMYMNKRDRKRS